MQRDPRVDDYIARSQEFARPILEHLRAAVHAAVPDVEETIKWSRPFFLLNGRILCYIAGFKRHCAFGVWNGNVSAEVKASGVDQDSGMGSFGRLERVADLPVGARLQEYIHKAAADLRDGKVAQAGKRNTGVKARA